MIALAALAGLGALTAWATLRRPGRDDATVPAWAPRLRPVAAASRSSSPPASSSAGSASARATPSSRAARSAGRLATVSSNRYEYWRVGLAAFAREPVTGLGAGGFRVEWLRERDIAESVKDVHSLELEMLAELGLPGLLAFAALLAGIALAARDGAARRPRRRGRERRRARRLAPARLDRLGLAVPRRGAARDRPRGRAARRARDDAAQSCRGAPSGSSARARSAAWRERAGSSSIVSTESRRHAFRFSGSRRTTSSIDRDRLPRAALRLQRERAADLRPRVRVQERRRLVVADRPVERPGLP